MINAGGNTEIVHEQMNTTIYIGEELTLNKYTNKQIIRHSRKTVKLKMVLLLYLFYYDYT